MATRERHTAEKANAESVVFDRANTVEIPASLWRHLRFEAKLALALRSRRTGGQRVNSARARWLALSSLECPGRKQKMAKKMQREEGWVLGGLRCFLNGFSSKITGVLQSQSQSDKHYDSTHSSRL